MIYSETQLISMAKNNPKDLIRILTSPDVDTRTLTFGAEVMGGEISDEAVTLPVFRKLLKHVNAIVREGAMVGVSAFYFQKKPPQEIIDKLVLMSNVDPSPSIRDYAKSLLEDYGNK